MMTLLNTMYICLKKQSKNLNYFVFSIYKMN